MSHNSNQQEKQADSYIRNRWEVHYHGTEHVGANMAEFAIGSLSTMTSRNPLIDVDGMVPHLGSCLTVYWVYLIALVFSIAAVHFLLFVSGIAVASTVIIKDDSYLSTVRLLRSIVSILGSSGTVMRGKDLSAAIQRHYSKGVVYGPQDVTDSTFYALRIDEDVEPRQHPGGTYL